MINQSTYNKGIEMIKLEAGQTLVIDQSSRHNHGCTDWAEGVVRPDLSSIKVTAANSCHSCWQVGHDKDHVFAEVGDVIRLDDSDLDWIEPSNGPQDWILK